eukprot:4313797-Amphidinium_carterae.1
MQTQHWHIPAAHCTHDKRADILRRAVDSKNAPPMGVTLEDTTNLVMARSYLRPASSSAYCRPM